MWFSIQDSPNTAQIEREHTEAEQRRQKLLIDRQQVLHRYHSSTAESFLDFKTTFHFLLPSRTVVMLQFSLLMQF